MAPRRDTPVLAVLLVLYLAFELARMAAVGIDQHLTWNVTLIVVSVVSAIGGIAAVRDSLPID